jgi:hypothetical protein
MSTAHVTDTYDRICAALGRKTDPAQLAQWKEVLEPAKSQSLLGLARKECLSRPNWFPNPGDLLEAYKRIEAEQPVGPSALAEPEHWRRATYLCRDCRDTGYRSVYSVQSMEKAVAFVRGNLSGTKLKQQLNPVSACCDCDLGVQAAKNWTRKRRQEEETYAKLIFRSPPMIPFDRNDPVACLLNWAESFRGRNYVPEFENFN